MDGGYKYNFDNCIYMCVFFGFLRKGGSGATNFTKSRARLNENTKNVTFKDVAGADEEKAELAEIVEFLKKSSKVCKSWCENT